MLEADIGVTHPIAGHLKGSNDGCNRALFFSSNQKGCDKYFNNWISIKAYLIITVMLRVILPTKL